MSTLRRICALQSVVMGALLLLIGGFPSGAHQIEVELRPLAGQDPADVMLWEICFESDVELHRLTVGAIPPTTYDLTTETMEWVDCVDGMACSDVAGDIFDTTYTTVYPSHSFAESVGGTLFLVLEGILPIVEGALTSGVNWNLGHECVARLELSAGVAITNPPGLVSLVDPGTASITWGSSCVEPIVVNGYRGSCDSSSGGSGLVSLASSVVVASTIPDDFDEDLRRDEDDNCVYTSNVGQSDVGGLRSSSVDYVGDACQCGEGEGSGQILSTDSDLPNMLEYLRGGAPAGFDVARCSVASPSTCTIHDAAVLASALDPSSGTASLDNVCNADSP